MNEGKENIIIEKSYAFALEIVSLYKSLIEKKEFVLSKQVLRSGTAIGANIHEAIASESKKDFVHKLGIAVKEARETSYWLNLLKDGKFITHEEFAGLDKFCSEIIKNLKQYYLNNQRKIFRQFIIHNS